MPRMLNAVFASSSVEAHGASQPSLTAAHLAESAQVLADMAKIGVDLKDMTLNTLEVEGVQKFIDSYHDLLKTVENAMHSLQVG